MNHYNIRYGAVDRYGSGFQCSSAFTVKMMLEKSMRPPMHIVNTSNIHRYHKYLLKNSTY